MLMRPVFVLLHRWFGLAVAVLPNCFWLEPIDAIAEFTPITAPCPSMSGPPELPGLIAASV